MNHPVGSLCHFELFALDLDQSAKFYEDLFGWKCYSPEPDYLTFEDPSGLSGGFNTSGAPLTNSVPTFYIKVADIPEALKKALALGGSLIQKKTDIGGGYGFYALFRDPAGNNIGVWSPE